jgi:penicillin-binding protein 1C
LHALWQGVRAGRNVRGASTITEQVVRMLVPRPRTLWSKWVEGFDAHRLEHMATKTDILEFYLNQVPYASNHRGVVAAARHYFNRDLDTLDGREMLALAILPRAPSGLDPYRSGAKLLDRRSIHLATAMRRDGYLSGDAWEAIIETPLTLEKPVARASIGHFRTYVERQIAGVPDGERSRKVTTTIDSGLMDFTQGLVDQRVAMLARRRVRNAAALVVDRRSGDILAWVVAGSDPRKDVPGQYLDAVLVPRQPGSALKPLLYAASFDAGWSPGTMIEDGPLSEAVGTGIHRFNNYSRQYHGEVTVRQALGNSLNIPAIHAVNFVGPEHYLDILHDLGFKSLTRGAGFYGDGLALGNGEVSLLELVQGFAALANQGRTMTLKATEKSIPYKDESHQVFTPQSATMVSDILSDPWARSMEFGRYSLLDFPVQTAVKTGTSTDYRDAWSVGYDDRFVVGIWMGNLDQTPTDGLTGSIGPAMVLRGVFAYLNRDQNTSKLALDPELFLQENCTKQEQSCTQIEDYRTASSLDLPPREDKGAPVIVTPSEHLRLAYDPRLPADRQSYRFILGGVTPVDKVTWIVNGEEAGTSSGGDFDWRVERGYYSLVARVERAGGERLVLGPVDFSVR